MRQGAVDVDSSYSPDPRADESPALEAAQEPLRVVVCEKCAATRAGLRHVLEEDGCCICGESRTAVEAIVVALRERPDTCLMASRLPGDTLRAVATIVEHLPRTAVVMFGDAPSASDLFAAVGAGAVGWFLEDADTGRLSHTLRRAAGGEAALPRALVADVLREFRARKGCERTALFGNLTTRELEVLDLLRQGMSTGQIADSLYVAKVTVRTHVSAILKKLGAADRETAVQLAFKG